MAKKKFQAPRYFLMTSRVYMFDEPVFGPVKNLYFYEPVVSCFAYDSIDAANAAASRLLSPESVFDFHHPEQPISSDIFCKWFSGPNLADAGAGPLNRYRVDGTSLGLMLLREVVSGKENNPVAAKVTERNTCDDRWTQGLWKSTKDRIASASSTVSARTIVGELLPTDMSWVQPGFPFFEMLETLSLE